MPSPTATTTILHRQIIQTYQLLVLAQTNAVLLDETARRYESGMLEDAGLMQALIALNAAMMTLDGVALEISIPALLATDLREALMLSMTCDRILDGWLRGELDAAGVMEEMQSVLSRFEAVVLGAEQGLVSGYDFDQAHLSRIRGTTLEMMMQQVLAMQAET